MNMNPMQLLKIKGMLEQFQRSHPKLPLFCKAAAESLDEGSVVEIRVTTAEGKTLCSNIRVTHEDMELIRQAREMGQSVQGN